MKKMTLDIQRFNSTNKTTHYELSQYVANDKPTYLVDYNDDMEAIDTGIYEAKTQADLGVTNASVAQTTAENAQTTANTAVTNASTAQTTADSNSTKIGVLADLTTTNKSNLVGAISEVNDKTPQILDSYTSSTTDVYCADYVNGLVEVEEFTSQVTFNETVAGNTHFYKYGKLIIVMLQGENKAHSNGNTIATIPVGYRPSSNVYAPFTKNNNAYGSLSMENTGDLVVNQISSATVNGRIYANFSYFVD